MHVVDTDRNNPKPRAMNGNNTAYLMGVQVYACKGENARAVRKMTEVWHNRRGGAYWVEVKLAGHQHGADQMESNGSKSDIIFHGTYGSIWIILKVSC